MNKPSYTISGEACSDFKATVAEFNRVFATWWFEGYWDGNLDTFNDILDWVNGGEPSTLIWSESAAARRHLGHQAMAAWLTDKVLHCERGYGQEWREDLAQAERGLGPTMFDWLVEIISDHEQIELRLK